MIPALIAVAVLSGQATVTVTVKPQTPFQITWDEAEDGSGPSFRFWCDGGIVKNFTVAEAQKAPTPNADGTSAWTATVPGLAAGTHSCFVSAFNAVAESKGDAVPLLVGIVPATPIHLRIVVTVGGGK